MGCCLCKQDLSLYALTMDETAAIKKNFVLQGKGYHLKIRPITHSNLSVSLCIMLMTNPLPRRVVTHTMVLIAFPRMLYAILYSAAAAASLLLQRHSPGNYIKR